ncbi:hypothetical protein [Streptomyces arenae]|uniref:hypothetical protein n=1 Tax=Streptomyces arenae TaxID=29301 RepID=UPI00265A6C17|nr:hypothetical protein [Streptomyces arenae]MCG7210130.1 hypothetical protein [Streptomyces arenae]
MPLTARGRSPLAIGPGEVCGVHAGGKPRRVLLFDRSDLLVGQGHVEGCDGVRQMMCARGLDTPMI